MHDKTYSFQKGSKRFAGSLCGPTSARTPIIIMKKLVPPILSRRYFTPPTNKISRPKSVRVNVLVTFPERSLEPFSDLPHVE